MDHPKIITPGNEAEFFSNKMGKVTLFQSQRMLVGLNGFEIGLEHKLHSHHGMDKMYYVLEGTGLFLLEGKELPMQDGNMLIAPSGVAHGIRNTGNTKLLVMVVLSPSP